MAKDLNGKKLPKGITKRNDNLYMGRFQYEGTRHTFYDDDVEKLLLQMEDAKYELRHGIYEKEQNITVDGWFTTWIEEYKKNSVKETTIYKYKVVYDRHIKKIMGKKKIKDVRAENIQSIYNRMSKTYSKKMINLVAAILSGMFKQAHKNQIIRKNPVPLTTLPKTKDKSERRVLSIEEQKRLLEDSEGLAKDMIEVLLSTGMRSGEIRALEWTDIDFNNKVIHVTGTLAELKGNVSKGAPKTRTSYRDIPMLNNVYNILKRTRKEQKTLKFKLGDKWKLLPNLKDLVFTNERGAHISGSWLGIEIRRVEEKIRAAGHDFEHVYPHSFRHTFATRCIENGMPPQVLKTILGHSTLAMTMDLYSHVLPNTKAQEMEKIANLF